MEYAGNHWYKCDLHLHTMSSECYLDKDNTPEQWVNRALEMGLNAVAVTDHNDYRGINAIMEEGQKKGLTVFPGTEITCDSSKIHMLILFNTDKNGDTVRDFLNRCDIDSEIVGNSEGTSLSVFEVCEIAKKRGAMVIAAHIDEFNSISSMNSLNQDKLLKSGLIDAVQVANVDVWRQFEKDKDTDKMVKVLKDKYGNDVHPEVVDAWRKCYNRALKEGLPMLSFSDNPHSAHESKHGLWGIGSVYTWIEMADNINLNSLKQSLITYQSRVAMIFDSPDKPKSEPDYWIQYLEVRNSELNPHSPLHIDFNPRLNCIIGGRGSGKSAIIRLFSGIYQRLQYSASNDLYEQQGSFYQQKNDEGKGIFHDNSEIEMAFKWYKNDYRLVITSIKDIHHQIYTLYKKNMDEWHEINANEFLVLMNANVFCENEIYEIVKNPEELLETVDALLPDMSILQARKQYYRTRLIILSMDIKAEEQLLNTHDSVLKELEWLNDHQSEYENEPFFNTLISTRNEQLSLFDTSELKLKEKKAEREDYLTKYEACLTQIRELRSAFLDNALANDPSYKMKLIPMSNRNSFYAFMQNILSVKPDVIEEDLKKCETLLFAKKNGSEQFRNALLDIRYNKTVNYSNYFMHLIQNMTQFDFEECMLFYPEDELEISFCPIGGKKFYPILSGSAGEKVPAVLSLILFNEINPLIIDQPEDYLDNHIIYEEIVEKLKKAKANRQIIVVTRNANIVTNADAEMIISMDSKSKFSRIHVKGALDDLTIRKEICEILEGSEKAFLDRARKYHLDK